VQPVAQPSSRALQVHRSPKPELYDLETDARETQNRYDRERNVAFGLRARLMSLHQVEGRPRTQSPTNQDVISRLRSLGYLGGAPSTPSSGADPKDRLAEYARYHAVKALNATSLISPDYPPAEQLLGTIWLLKEDYVRARQQFAHLAAIAPENYGAHYNLGILVMREGRIEEARRELQAAARADASSGEAHLALGSLYYSQGDWSGARDELRQAVAINPNDEA
jgi:tetratricopeptide (TPR) repeat protein